MTWIRTSPFVSIENINTYIKIRILVRCSLLKNQHTYRAAMSTKTALHSLVCRRHRGTSYGEVALQVKQDYYKVNRTCRIASILEADQRVSYSQLYLGA